MGQMSTILGYVYILRFAYLMFPHIWGDAFFAYRQQQDRNRDDSEMKELPTFRFSHTYFQETLKRDYSYKGCKGCFKDFEETEEVAEMLTCNHFMHKACALKWFNE
jgi:hypothetical protein